MGKPANEATARQSTPIDPGTRIGHVHLKVADI
jgi:catechol-2,3-dioxygenase